MSVGERAAADDQRIKKEPSELRESLLLMAGMSDRGAEMLIMLIQAQALIGIFEELRRYNDREELPPTAEPVWARKEREQ